MRLIASASAGARGIVEKLKENFVLPYQAELAARALLDRFEPLFEIAYIGVERAVTHLQPRVHLPLRRDLPVHLPHPEPTALAGPERILDCDDEGRERERKPFHGGRSW